MSIADAFKHQAPPVPNYAASYRAIYLEPILGSGERFSIGIIAQDESGEARVVQTLANKTMRCMYGEQYQAINNIVSITLNSAEQHLKEKQPMPDWHPPFGGITLGDIQETRSNAGMEGVLFQAITSYASLYQGDIVANGIADFTETEPERETDADTSRLITRVKNLVLDKNNNLAPCWNRSITAVNGTRINIDYMGWHYNANFANFDVKYLKTAYKFAQAKLLELELLRNKREKEAIDNHQTFELLIGVNDKMTNEAQDYYQNLEKAADEQALRVISSSSPTPLAQRILQKEAA